MGRLPVSVDWGIRLSIRCAFIMVRQPSGSGWGTIPPAGWLVPYS